MKNNSTDRSVLEAAATLGLVPAQEIKDVFYLIVTDRSEEDINEIKSRAALAGFYFNGFGAVGEEGALEFVYNS